MFARVTYSCFEKGCLTKATMSKCVMGNGGFTVSALEKETAQTRVLMPSPSFLSNAVNLNQVDGFLSQVTFHRSQQLCTQTKHVFTDDIH